MFLMTFKYDLFCCHMFKQTLKKTGLLRRSLLQTSKIVWFM